MTRRHVQLPFAALVLAAAGLSALADPAHGQVLARQAVQAQPLRYWTPERMREAIRNSAAAERRREARAAVGGRPRPARTELPGMRAIGRVFSVKPDGQPWSCTGTLVDSANRSLVWTAGHCIHRGRGGGFHTQIAFAPAYRPGATGNPMPYGLWPAARFAVTESYARKGISEASTRLWRTANLDVAAIVLARDSAQRLVQDVVGMTQHIRIGVRRPGAVRMLGYPVAAPYNGEVLMQCGPSRPRGEPWAIGLLGIRCYGIGPGMSGGPALAHMNALGIGTVVGEMTVTNLRRMYVSYRGRQMRQLYRSSSHAPV